MDKEGTKKKMSKKIILVLTLILAGTAAFACDMSFFIQGPNSLEKRISPDKTTNLKKGVEYILRINFREDHGRCEIPAEATVFLLNDEKWKTEKEDTAFNLNTEIEWIKTSFREYEAKISFSTKEAGEAYLEIIRECIRKGGYNEVFTFNVI